MLAGISEKGAFSGSFFYQQTKLIYPPFMIKKLLRLPRNRIFA
jgi:hypothetical protein